jgi:hypothetical protein
MTKIRTYNASYAGCLILYNKRLRYKVLHTHFGCSAENMLKIGSHFMLTINLYQRWLADAYIISSEENPRQEFL